MRTLLLMAALCVATASLHGQAPAPKSIHQFDLAPAFAGTTEFPVTVSPYGTGDTKKSNGAQIADYLDGLSLTLTNKTIDGGSNTLSNIAQSSVTSLTTDLAGKQPLDSDLTAIAALTTTSFGRSSLTLADDAALRALAGLANVENTALSTWAGSANLTTLGTISTGVWAGTVIDGTKVEVQQSIVGDSSGLKLNGDVTSPGNKMVYGTDGSGAKGWQALAVDVQQSIVQDAGGLKLDGDLTSPGNNKVYGTDGSGAKGWQTAPVAPAYVDVQVFTSSGTWTKPANAAFVEIIMHGGSSGAGSGRLGTAGSARGGGGGGAPGAMVKQRFIASFLGATEAFVCGDAGVGGASVTTPDTNGNAGTAGGDSTFAGLIARGGAGGAGGTASTAAGGASVANSFFNYGSTGTGNTGGTGQATVAGSAPSTSSTVRAGSAGAGGGGVNASDTEFAGGAGGTIGFATSSGLFNGGTAGATGGAGGNGPSSPEGSGTGGGGGGGGHNRDGGAGGNGGLYGGGGGGGGGSTNGFASGKGGDGVPGYLIVITYLNP